MRDHGGRLEEFVEAAGCDLGVMRQRSQSAIAIGAEADGLARRGAMTDWTVHLVTSQYKLYRSASQPGRKDAQHLRSRDQPLRSEATSQERAPDQDVLRSDAEQSGDPGLRHGHALARRVNCQP